MATSLVAELAEKLSSATNNLDFDEQTLFLNTSADTVGIGTNSPGAKLDVRGSALFNEGGDDVDFRIEGDTQTHLFFLDASTDRIGINSATPGVQFDVVGATTITGATIHTGTTQLTGAVTVGVDGTGHDVVFYGDTAGSKLTWDESADALLLTDSSPIHIGDSADMKLYHDGSNSYITNAVGALKVATETSGIAVTIGHTTSEVTVADNLTVTGTSALDGVVSTASHVDMPDNANIKLGGGDDLQLYHDGTNSYITNATGALKIATETSGIAVTIGHTTSSVVIADDATVIGAFSAVGGAVFNEDTAAMDFRIESDDDTHIFFVDGSEDKIGIGTSAPGSKLHVEGTDPGSGNALIEAKLTNNSNNPVMMLINENTGGNATDNNGLFIDNRGGSGDSYSIRVKNSSTEIFAVRANGFVGVGTSAPGTVMQIKNTAATQFSVYGSASMAANVGGGIGFVCNYTTGGDPAGVASIYGLKENATSGQYGGYMSFHTRTNGSSEAERMRIDHNGYVGIGSTAPTAPLDVVATTGAAIARIVQNTSSSQSLYVKNSSASFASSMQYMSTELNDSANGNFGWYSDTNDVKIKMNTNGDGWWDGAADNGAADYAEYFEADSDNSSAKISHGTTVVLINGKIRPATSGEQPIGIIRPHDGVAMVGNSAWSRWQRKGLRDDYGKRILEEYTTTVWTDADGELHDVATDELTQRGFVGDKAPPADAVVKDAYTDEDGITGKLTRTKQNPDWNTSHTYVQREDRPEWNIVGLLGQIPITKGQPTNSNWIKMWDISDTVEMWFVK